MGVEAHVSGSKAMGEVTTTSVYQTPDKMPWNTKMKYKELQIRRTDRCFWRDNCPSCRAAGELSMRYERRPVQGSSGPWGKITQEHERLHNQDHPTYEIRTHQTKNEDEQRDT